MNCLRVEFVSTLVAVPPGQDVSGYIVLTLIEYGQLAFADRVSEWLPCVQRPEGSFVDPDQGVPFVFDIGQALRGLVACATRRPSDITWLTV